MTNFVLEEKWDIDDIKKLQSGNFNLNIDIKESLNVILKNIENSPSGTNKTSYSFSKNAIKAKRQWGRQYSTPGYQNISSIVRKICGYKYYHDIDMVNSQPCILEQLAKQHNINCEELSKYNQNREKYIEDIINDYREQNIYFDRDDVKKMILKSIYGCKYTHINLKKMYNCISEIKNIFFFINHENDPSGFFTECQDIVNYANIEHQNYKDDNDMYIRGLLNTSLSLLLNKIENEILMTMVEFFQLHNLKVGSLIFDGLLLEKCDNLSVLMLECESYILKKTNYNIKLIEKDLTPNFDKLAQLCNSIKHDEYIQYTDKVNYDFFKSKADTYDVIALVYETGTGKTEACCKLLQEYQKQDPMFRMISITNNRSLNSQIIRSFKRNNIECISYAGNEANNIKFNYKTFNMAPYKSCQLDSATNKVDTSLIDKHTIVYLDEFSDLTRYLSSSDTLYTKRKAAYDTLVEILNNCGKILITDADLNDISMSFLKEVLIDKTRKICLIKNEKQPIKYIDGTNKQLEVKFYIDAYDIYVKNLLNTLKTDKTPTAIILDTRAEKDRIKKMISEDILLKDLDILIYAKDEGRIEDLFEDIDRIWYMRCIMMTPSITTGLSFIGNAVHILGMFTNTSVSYITFTQMLERFRRKYSISILFESKQFNPNINLGIIKKNIFNKFYDAKSILKKVNFSDNNFELDIDEPLTKLMINYMFQNRIDKIDTLNKLIDRLHKKGYLTEIIKTEKHKPIKTINTKEIKLKKIEELRTSLIKSGVYPDHLKKIYEEYKQRCDIIGIDIIECAKENKYLWKTISETEGLSMENFYILKSLLDDSDSFNSKLQYRYNKMNVLDIINDRNTQITIQLKNFQKNLGIQLEATKKDIINNANNVITLDENIFKVLNTKYKDVNFTEINKPNINWYEAYKKYKHIIEDICGKDLVQNKRCKHYFKTDTGEQDSKQYSYLEFDKDLLERIKML